MTASPAIRRLGLDDAPFLAGLLAAYAGEMRGEPPRPASEAGALALLADPAALVLGAHGTGAGSELDGFAVVFDLPEAVSGRRAGQLDDLFVARAARGRGLAAALIHAAAAEGRRREWVHLRWLVPQDNPAALALYRRIAEPAPWLSFVIRLAPDSL